MPHPATTTSQDARYARCWLGIAVVVLILAGLLALLLVVARMPPFDRLVEDPQFFRRCLVVHVNLSLVLWFCAFLAALMFLLPPHRDRRLLARTSVWLAGSGVLLQVLAAWMPGSEPVISNYVPTIDHWLFGTGQALFAAALLAVIFSRRLLPVPNHEPWMPVPAAVLCALRAAAVAVVLAALTFLSARLAIHSDLAPLAHYEILFWGGGHVLQLVNVIAMLAVWLLLAGSLMLRSPIRKRTASALFGLLLLPWLIAPVLPTAGGWTATYKTGFTMLMQYGIFPVVLVFVVVLWRRLHARSEPAGRLSWRDPRYSGFVASVVLTLLGFVLGAMIRGSNTMIPAHYHASIGAVTVAFMAATYVLLARLGFPITTGRLRRLAGWQPIVFGSGQMVFAFGFALAGAYGMQRKAYGAEQAERSLAETVGLTVMGVGGFIAIAGGVLFLTIVATAWLKGRRAVPQLTSTSRALPDQGTR